MIILAVIIGLSLLIMFHEAGHFFVAKLFGMKVDEFGFGFPPKLFSKKKGETEYSFNLLPFGGFVKIAGETDRVRDDLGELNALPEEEKKRIFLFQKPWKRALVILAGVAANFLLGWILVSSLLMIGSKPLLYVSDVQKNSPAAEVGIKKGDIILGYTESQKFIDTVNANRGKELQINILRDGKEISLKAVPRETGEGALGVFFSEAGIPKYGFFESIWQGLLKSIEMSGMVIVAFVQLFKTLFFKAQLLEGVVGPLGIFGVAQEAGKVGLIYLVQLFALISLNLAVMNLIPFPALDGGRFFMIIIEKIKGSPISPKTEGIINSIGFVFLIILMVLITARDISRMF